MSDTLRQFQTWLDAVENLRSDLADRSHDGIAAPLDLAVRALDRSVENIRKLIDGAGGSSAVAGKTDEVTHERDDV